MSLLKLFRGHRLWLSKYLSLTRISLFNNNGLLMHWTLGLGLNRRRRNAYVLATIIIIIKAGIIMQRCLFPGALARTALHVRGGGGGEHSMQWQPPSETEQHSVHLYMYHRRKIKPSLNFHEQITNTLRNRSALNY